VGSGKVEREGASEFAVNGTTIQRHRMRRERLTIEPGDRAPSPGVRARLNHPLNTAEVGK
jgi:hypothetical protein